MWRSVAQKTAGRIGFLVVATFCSAAIIALVLLIAWALTVNTNLLGR
jgi:hypothetical protein